MQKLYLRKREERRLLAGHQWVFSNELLDVPKNLKAGESVSVFTESHQFLGTGFFNPNSLIAVRLLSDADEEIDEAFFESRLQGAWNLRKRLYPESVTNAFRLSHAESDGLSGLVIDKFANVISVQIFSAGMEQHLETICDVLERLFSPAAIVLRNESQLRTLEGLPLYSRVARGELKGNVEIHDADIKYSVDVLQGHKTGFFLDQRENRKRIRPFAKDADVLDVFTSDGGFALNAAFAGAKSVLALDASEAALQRMGNNASLNGFKQISTVQGDAFELLKQFKAEARKFDVVVLDPPSLTKSKKNLSMALQAYRELNSLALSLVKSGGFLATASCSHHVSEDDFLGAIHKASSDAERGVVLLEKASQSPDHPVLLSMPETQYLKFALLAVA
ncbi:MAG: class I SAM-dependent rRNA methyltransferase [Rhizobacter sp.]|nr:class I SAM-dependent rRNA methyltransferase [Chlorobiales bacterium]